MTPRFRMEAGAGCTFPAAGESLREKLVGRCSGARWLS
jgi:hypothetical protein